jgi:putative transcriptional regulator
MREPVESLTNRVRKLRFEHGEMTQQELAKSIGVNRHTIMAIEAGKYAPSLLLAFRIASAFGCSIEQVFEYRPGKRD